MKGHSLIGQVEAGSCLIKAENLFTRKEKEGKKRNRHGSTSGFIVVNSPFCFEHKPQIFVSST